MPPKAFPTHFLCIPLVTASSRPQLTQALDAFAADVTNPAGFAVPRDAVRPVDTMHLTLGVFSLPRGEGLEEAAALLRSLNLEDLLVSPTPAKAAAPEMGAAARPARGSRPEAPTITLRGLSSMQAASRTSILYAPPVDRLGTLQAFCERIRAPFKAAGLLAEENRPLLLHATVVNTVYVKGKGRQARHGPGGRKEKLTMDARDILDRYEDQIWMDGFKVAKVALCRMGAKKSVVDGVEVEAYEVEAEVDL